MFIVDDDDEENLRKMRKGRCEDDDGWELERLELFSVWSLILANTHNHHSVALRVCFSA